ncbi:uncharacterized protein LOC128879923 [Hylaeus volcanicus]|uniref:uncharacterized protein LOC128879923 n=1 Tax=Hylaeus volcanicus TaxID=313075 RepID=UPI0023B7A684|nr:uncharacterized protein LOC128879923 [Hylaeus volcanicus]
MPIRLPDYYWVTLYAVESGQGSANTDCKLLKGMSNVLNRLRRCCFGAVLETVRRPAIQKQFYDIEERVVVRPAGSAVVELEQPTSKIQRGPALIQPLYPYQIQAGGQYNFGHSTIAPPLAPSSPAPNGEDSVVVDNPDFRRLQDQVHISSPQVRTSSNGSPNNEPFVAHDPSPSVIVSPKSTPEEDKNNQDRLLELLTARGNVAEVGYANNALSRASLDDNGRVKGRVLSATPAPDNAEPANERVSTRRVVLSRPIETFQEVNVVEPATKIERVSVQQPTLIKTARLDHVQVHGSYPVVGKALTPTLAHASIPVYQKTISPAYSYYH